ncbi:cytochrome P450 [Lysobacter arseniciresistens ZS79]|uniref:Cytochrome P450 n=1 Tax=Lysobacter arseniciresistens ZS79 TaxID=913325 RepID=A0A0A0F3E7_9GAMM|nr:cytochrome P450 [Lysobacter arseniciresistens]KGM57676.1 cytochrome P450 [Lysobacter arseniciresistens ZS79]
MTEHTPDGLPTPTRDQRAATDALRPCHGVVRNQRGDWILLRHDLVVQAALDDAGFSSAVSRYLQIPNGLDGDRHAAYRQALDPFLDAAALEPFLDDFRRIATGLVASLPRGGSVDAVSNLGARFAVRAQSAWLGWPAELEDRLVDWVAENHAATRSGDRDWTLRVAEDFDTLIHSVLDTRRDGQCPGGARDVTSALMRTQVEGRPLEDAEIVSVLRNWTGGDLGSIALCVGVLVHRLASDPALQQRLRAGVAEAEFDALIDEILRIDNPFLSNRRITTRPLTIGGVDLPAAARVTLHWTSANRDSAVFGDPDALDPQANRAHNLVYGIGRHACPGRLLSTLELRIVLRALLDATASVTLDPDDPAERAMSPAGGWSRVPVILR